MTGAFFLVLFFFDRFRILFTGKNRTMFIGAEVGSAQSKILS